MSTIDNESLQPVPDPERPHTMEVKCAYCAGAGKVPRFYSGKDGRSYSVLGKCACCGGRGRITVECSER